MRQMIPRAWGAADAAERLPRRVVRHWVVVLLLMDKVVVGDAMF